MNRRFATPAMAAVHSAQATVQRMLDVEAALARAAARAGAVPTAAAEAIADECRAERFDVPGLWRAAAEAGTPVVPLVDQLRRLVGAEAGAHVHPGATSQDIIDSAAVLQARDGLDLLLEDVLGLAAACAALAERHRSTPMAGRTLLQEAVPITFGLKAARWLASATRAAHRLRAQRRGLVVQFGGAAGTLAAPGDRGLRMLELLAEELGLGVPELPWHAERDRVADLGAALAVTAGVAAKIATDVVLLSQTEVGEVRSGAGPSSAMPHKRNPVDAVTARAAARLAQASLPVLLAALEAEHERAAGAWQAEWAALPELFAATSGAIARTRAAVEGLEVDPERMAANLHMAGGPGSADALIGRALEGYAALVSSES